MQNLSHNQNWLTAEPRGPKAKEKKWAFSEDLNESNDTACVTWSGKL